MKQNLPTGPPVSVGSLKQLAEDDSATLDNIFRLLSFWFPLERAREVCKHELKALA
jgi:hypothetical protein